MAVVSRKIPELKGSELERFKRDIAAIAERQKKSGKLKNPRRVSEQDVLCELNKMKLKLNLKL